MQNNKSRFTEWQKNWNEQHKERRKILTQKFKEMNPQYYQKYLKTYFKTENGREKLRHSIHKRRAMKRNVVATLTIKEWKEIIKETTICSWCKKPFTIEEPPTQDHIIPLSLGGSHEKINIQALHKKCNREKRTQLTWKALLVASKLGILFFLKTKKLKTLNTN